VIGSSLTGHMLQHVALSMVAPTALLLVPHQPRGFARIPAVAAWTAFVSIQAAVHLTGFFDVAQQHFWVHALEHLLLFASGLVFWAPLARLGGPAAALYLLLAMPATGLVGLVLMLDDQTLYSHYGLAEQHRAGAAMWAAGSLVMATALVAVVWQRLAREERLAQAREALGP
jgi:cytochrome c oxidase assembly factor CtaG